MDALIEHFVQMVQQVRIPMVTLLQLFQHLVISEDECGQSFKMSILLHGTKSLSQILPKEKRVNRNSFDT